MTKKKQEKTAYKSQQFLQSMEKHAQVQPISTPAEWLDLAENHDLLPPPNAKLIPQTTELKLVKPVNKTQEAIKYLMFKEAYGTSLVGLIPPHSSWANVICLQKLRPDIQGAHLVKVTVNRRLTPESYERNVFHIEFDTTGVCLMNLH
jgi:sulfite reductase alpha subunit-like flavoprotein